MLRISVARQIVLAVFALSFLPLLGVTNSYITCVAGPRLKRWGILLGLLLGGVVQAAWLFTEPDFDNAWAREFAEETYQTNKRTEPLDPADAALFDPIKFGVLIPGTETVTTNAAGQVVKRKTPTRYSLAPVTNFLAKVKSEKGVRISLGKGEYCFGCMMSKVDLEEPSLPEGSVIAYVHLGGVVVWYPPEEIASFIEAGFAEALLRTHQRGSGGAAGPGWVRYGFYSYSAKEGGQSFPVLPKANK